MSHYTIENKDTPGEFWDGKSWTRDEISYNSLKAARRDARIAGFYYENVVICVYERREVEVATGDLVRSPRKAR